MSVTDWLSACCKYLANSRRDCVREQAPLLVGAILVLQRAMRRIRAV